MHLSVVSEAENTEEMQTTHLKQVLPLCSQVTESFALDFKGKGERNLLKTASVEQTLWASPTEEGKSWFLTLSDTYYIGPFLTYNWEETAANKRPFSCGHFWTSFLSAPSVAKPEANPFGLLEYCSLLLHEFLTTP